ncbi:hypothetical protein B0G69_7168 [Paraburkholderia sp. RAU2J]|uniref:hypothetical protein n=1 Tax=Paraburkholderia sp. RAU2J TaxID=1938810 RepID=UPI000F23E906|nr:hypothetical protein [Paraburkholderia sp. RAU2J]RKT13951.1 hypothetical protein B0G69_7168 [Paraburkholderia sp. RAU2J]
MKKSFLKVASVSSLKEKTDRAFGAADANAQDADLWRWFTLLVQDRRLRWCQAQDRWFVSVDNRHVATESSFDQAIRSAKARVQKPDREDRAACVSP